MSNEELTALLAQGAEGVDKQYEAGFQKALALVLEKREEFGHGYLKGKLLDWILELQQAGGVTP